MMKPFKQMAYMAVAAMFCLIQSAYAADTVHLEFGAQGKESELRLSIGKSQIIQSRTALEQVVIGSPSIADIKLLSSRQVLILGINPGRTNLVFRDKKKNLIAVMDVVVGYDLNGIKRKLSELLPNEDGIEVRGSNHSVILSGQVNSVSSMDQAINVAKSYVPGDKVINLLEVAGGQQVMLEVHIAEVSRRSLRELGVKLDYTHAGGSRNPLTVVTGDDIVNAFGTVSATNVRSNGFETLGTTIQALEQRGLAKTLAEPNLVALSGQEANFLAGGEIPIPVAQSGTGSSTVISVDYKEFGVGLKFTPSVLSNDKISIKLNTEVSAIDTSNTFSTNGIDLPTILTRRAGTTVEMADGQAFAIAGLMQADMNNAINQFPGLGSIPILGALFRSSDYQRNETELVVVITPRLVEPVNTDKLRYPTDNIVPPNAIDQYLLGTLDHVDILGWFGYSDDEEEADTSKQSGMEGSYGHKMEGGK